MQAFVSLEEEVEAEEHGRGDLNDEDVLPLFSLCILNCKMGFQSTHHIHLGTYWNISFMICRTKVPRGGVNFCSARLENNGFR